MKTKTQAAVTKLDAAESLFLQRELQQVETRVFETPFAPLQSEEVVPTQWDVDEGAEEYVYDRVTGLGIAQLISSAAEDIPRAAVKRERKKLPMASLGSSYGYTVQEIRAAKFAGRSLDDAEAKAARRAIDSKRNQMHLEGDVDIDYPGFINDPSVPQGNATNGNWDTATGDEILQDLNDMWLDVWTTCKKVYKPNVIALPDAKWARITTTPRGPNSDTTIAEYFLANNPAVKALIPLSELEGAGVGGTDRAVCFYRDPEVLFAKGAIMFKQYPPEQTGFQIVVICEGRIGPCHWRVPITAKYVDGI